MRDFLVTDATALKIWGNQIPLAEFNRHAAALNPDRAKRSRSYTPNRLRAIRQSAGLMPVRPEAGRPYVITVNSAKGGVGKTLMAANLAVIFTVMGYRVLVIDGDPQSSCTAIFGYESYEQGLTLKNLLLTDEKLPLESALHHVYNDGSLALLGSRDRELEDLELALGSAHEGPVHMAAFYERYADELKQYDIIVVDTNPWTPRLNAAYTFASDYIMVPADLEGFSIRTLNNFIDKLQRRARNPFTQSGYKAEVKLVANRFEKNRVERLENFAVLRQSYADALMPVYIPNSPAFLKQGRVALKESRPLAESDSTSPGIAAMHALAQCMETDLFAGATHGR